MNTRILYNGSCPICRREISAYARYAKTHDLPLDFQDMGQTDLNDWGVTADQAARRIHVIKDGQLYDGIPAFALVWDDMPRFRWLAKAVRWPGVSWLASATYDLVLAPALYAMHRRRQAKQG
ncbi:MAG: DUF393 domain-containing protein [Pseudomonadota bacterium]